MGRKKGCPVLRWVRASIFLPLFCSTKMIVTYAARLSRSGVLGGRVCFVFERKMTLPRTITFVFPGNFVFVYSQAQQAKKKEPRTRLVVMLGALSRRAMISVPEELKSARSSRGVMAFCRLGAGSWLLEVQGALLVIVAERCSQTACGSAHSTADHGRATASCKFTRVRPFSRAIEAEEGSQGEFLLIGA
jgi:hypothetical protein